MRKSPTRARVSRLPEGPADFSEPDFLFRLFFNTRGYSVGVQRFFMDSAASLLPAPPGARFRYATVGGVPAMWVKGFETPKGPLILYLHGGGYGMGAPRTHRSLSAYLARAAGAKALVPDYRLAPEHPFPAALEDALTVYRFLVRHGVPSERIAIAGDSAGGGLAAALLLALAKEGDPLPAAAYLMSPWVDLSPSNRFYRFMKSRTKHVVDWGADTMAAMYAGDADPLNPLISPVYGDFSGLPPLLVTAGRAEPLRHDGRRLVERARLFGVTALFEPYEGPVHVLQALAPLSKPVEAIVNRGGEFIRAHCG